MNLIKNEIHSAVYTACLLLAAVLFFSGCGQQEKPLTLSPETGEKMEVTLEGGDDFHMDYESGVLTVYEKKKVMMRCAFISEEQEKAQRESLTTMPFEIYREEDSYISYGAAGPEGMVHYTMYPVGKKTWIYAATHLPPEEADKVLGRLHFKEAAS